MKLLEELFSIGKFNVDEYIMKKTDGFHCSYFLNIYREINYIDLNTISDEQLHKIKSVNTIFSTMLVHYNYINIDRRFNSTAVSDIGSIQPIPSVVDIIESQQPPMAMTPAMSATPTSITTIQQSSTSFDNIQRAWVDDLLNSEKIKYVISAMLKFINDDSSMETIQLILELYMDETTLEMTSRKLNIYNRLFLDPAFLLKISKTSRWLQYTDESYMGQYINCIGELDIIESFDFNMDINSAIMKWFHSALKHNLVKMKLDYIHSKKHASYQLLVYIARIFVSCIGKNTQLECDKLHCDDGLIDLFQEYHMNDYIEPITMVNQPNTITNVNHSCSQEESKINDDVSDVDDDVNEPKPPSKQIDKSSHMVNMCMGYLYISISYIRSSIQIKNQLVFSLDSIIDQISNQTTFFSILGATNTMINTLQKKRTLLTDTIELMEACISEKSLLWQCNMFLNIFVKSILHVLTHDIYRLESIPLFMFDYLVEQYNYAFESHNTELINIMTHAQLQNYIEMILLINNTMANNDAFKTKFNKSMFKLLSFRYAFENNLIMDNINILNIAISCYSLVNPNNYDNDNYYNYTILRTVNFLLQYNKECVGELQSIENTNRDLLDTFVFKIITSSVSLFNTVVENIKNNQLNNLDSDKLYIESYATYMSNSLYSLFNIINIFSTVAIFNSPKVYNPFIEFYLYAMNVMVNDSKQLLKGVKNSIDTYTDNEVDTNADIVTEVDTNADIVTEVDTNADSVTEVDTNADSVTEVNADIVTEVDTNADSVTEVNADIVTEVNAEVNADIVTEVNAEVNTDVDTNVDADVDAVQTSITTNASPLQDVKETQEILDLLSNKYGFNIYDIVYYLSKMIIYVTQDNTPAVLYSLAYDIKLLNKVCKFITQHDILIPPEQEKLQLIYKTCATMTTLEIPDELCDPLTQLIMDNPVILPCSHAIMDRNTIARHLSNKQDDPFTRTHLTMDHVDTYNKEPDVIAKIKPIKEKLFSYKKSIDYNNE